MRWLAGWKPICWQGTKVPASPAGDKGRSELTRLVLSLPGEDGTVSFCQRIVASAPMLTPPRSIHIFLRDSLVIPPISPASNWNVQMTAPAQSSEQRNNVPAPHCSGQGGVDRLQFEMLPAGSRPDSSASTLRMSERESNPGSRRPMSSSIQASAACSASFGEPAKRHKATQIICRSKPGASLGQQ